MDVVSICPLPVASVLWQPRAGSWTLTVVCKATFLLAPGSASLAPEQEEPNEEDNHWNDDDGRSLYSANDLSPVKSRADVVLVGHAFAPAHTKVRAITARIHVGSVDKSVEVFCDRAFRQDGTIDEGPPFARMPLVYERAAGGVEAANPVGMRVDAVDAYGRVAVPNLQPPGRRITSRADFSDPIGFGPIAPAWPARREKLGRYAGTWAPHHMRQQPLPEDLDPLYFNIAPPDQQADELRDNERIVLENLHPEHARLVTTLPGVRPTAIVERAGRAPYAVALRGDTLWIDTDRSRCTLTWRGQVQLEQPNEVGRVVVSMEEGAAPDLDWQGDRRAGADAGGPRVASRDPDTLIPASAAPAVDLRGTGEFVQQAQQARAALPFAQSAPAPSAALPFGQPPAALPFAQSAPAQPREDRPSRQSGGLPFGPSAAPARSNERPPAWAPQPAARPAPSASPSEPPIFKPPPPPPPAASQLVAPAPVVPASALPPPPPVVLPPTQGPPVESSPWASAARGAPPGGSVAPATIGSAATLGAVTAVGAAMGAGAVMAPSVERSTLGGSSASASGTALSASNTAAGASAPAARANRADATPTRATPAWDTQRLPSSRTSHEGREVVDLLWFDQESVPRIRKRPPWRKIVDDLEKQPLDNDLDDAAKAKEPMDVEDRREVFEILIRGESTDPEGVNEALNGGVREDGKFVPPLVLLAGEIFFPFDELATLKVTVTTVTPIVGADENLRGTVDVAKDFLRMPDLATAPAVSEGLTTRIKDAFAQGKRVVAPGYLETQTERALLEGRHYQRREVFGGKHIRALLLLSGSQSGIPTYILEDMSKKLPMYQRFKARLIAEVHMPVDQYESYGSALRVVALGRVSATPRSV